MKKLLLFALMAIMVIGIACSKNPTSDNSDSAPTSTATWELVSSSITPTAGVASVASPSLTGIIVLKVTAHGGILMKPIAGNFSVWFAPSKQLTSSGRTNYSAANAIAVTPMITVTPSDATVGDDSSYLVTIVGTLFSSNANFSATVGSGYSEFMAINNITSVMNGVNTNQNWGIDTFYTPSALLVKSNLDTPTTIVARG